MRIKQKEDYVLRKIMDENMIFPIGKASKNFKGTIILNDIAAYIWGKAKNSIEYDDLLACILNEYDISVEIADNDLKKIIETFEEYNVIEIS